MKFVFMTMMATFLLGVNPALASDARYDARSSEECYPDQEEAGQCDNGQTDQHDPDQDDPDQGDNGQTDQDDPDQCDNGQTDQDDPDQCYPHPKHPKKKGKMFYDWARGMNGFGYCYAFNKFGHVMYGGHPQPNVYCERVRPSHYNWGRGWDGLIYCFQFTPYLVVMNEGRAVHPGFCRGY